MVFDELTVLMQYNCVKNEKFKSKYSSCPIHNNILNIRKGS